jgi:glutathione S-transferase
MTLHDYELDDGCYKVRLLLGALALPYAKIAVDVHPGRQHLSPRYLQLNAQGSLPILVDRDLVLHGAEAILAYLAHTYDAERTWLPSDPARFGQVMQWLTFAAGDLKAASIARLHLMMELEADGEKATQTARHCFRLMDDHIIKREFAGETWFVGGAATVADIALFPSIALSRDCGIDHDEYPALRRWMARMRSISGFITMPGIPSYY